MISNQIQKDIVNSDGEGNVIVYDIRCLSTDTKPTDGVPNGSTCIEIDTGTMYMYDAENDQWCEI